MVANEEQAAYWDGEEGGHWVHRAADYDRMLAGFSDAILDAASIAGGERVLDVGCGCGALTLAAAAAADPGTVTGVDLSAPMLAVARERAAAGAISNAEFVQADAQSHAFAPGAQDLLVSRFGVMFFADPTAAFANLARALRPDARLTFACWQDLFANEWMSVPGIAVAAHLPLPGGAEPGAPGPFAFADRDRVTGIVEAAGFTGISLDNAERPMQMPGTTADEVVDFLRDTGMGRVLFADAPADVVARAVDAVRTALQPYETSDGVVLSGRAWIVTATRA